MKLKAMTMTTCAGCAQPMVLTRDRRVERGSRVYHPKCAPSLKVATRTFDRAPKRVLERVLDAYRTAIEQRVSTASDPKWEHGGNKLLRARLDREQEAEDQARRAVLDVVKAVLAEEAPAPTASKSPPPVEQGDCDFCYRCSVAVAVSEQGPRAQRGARICGPCASWAVDVFVKEAAP